MGAAVTAALCLLPALSVAQVTGLELRGYYLNVATGSLEGPFTPAGVTDFQRLRLSTSPEFGVVGLDVAYEQGLQLYTDSELGGLPFASLGATELTDRLSTALGADLISYNQAADQDESSSLMVGKYLSPKLLVKYEQLLDRRNAYFVRLDYTLSRYFRLETSVGQGTESGLELKWAREY